MSRPITSLEMETVIRRTLNKQKSRTWWLHRWITEDLTSMLLKLFQKVTEEGKLPNSSYEATITLISKPKTPQKRKLWTIITDEHRCRNPQQNTSSLNPKTHSKDQVGFIPGMQWFFKICKSINVIHHIDKLKVKNPMIFSIDVEKAFDRVRHPFMIKNSPESGHRGNLSQL